MAWIMLVIAGLLEVGWAMALKYSEGFSRPGWTVTFVVLNVASMVLLGLATKSLPIGTAYAIWVGIGAAGTAILGMVLLGDPSTAVRIALIGTLLASVIGLKLAT